VINMERARKWLGRVEVRSDLAAPAPLAALLATLDSDEPAPAIGDSVPPLGHWLYFLSAERRAEMTDDGCGRGAFLPPVELPRRACAANRVQFHRALRVGDPISRTSRIVDIALRDGRAGPLVLVLVRHEIGDAIGVALSEDQQIVFRERAEPAAPEPARGAPAKAAWSRRFHADAATLFRYSSLSFDAHRIHYDRPYATFVEGHPGLVVQTGLVANLLLELLRRHAPDAQVVSFDCRTMAPLFDIEPFLLCGCRIDGGAAHLWAECADGRLAVEAKVTLNDDAPLVRPRPVETRLRQSFARRASPRRRSHQQENPAQ
jgi:3-methylfumaryl-CoA hydratase